MKPVEETVPEIVPVVAPEEAPKDAEMVEEKKDNPTTNPNTYLSQGDGVSKPSSAVAKEPEVEQPKDQKEEDKPMSQPEPVIEVQ